MNKFYGVGYLVADLESREVADKLVANGAIAISRRYAIDKTDFINISIWGKSAEYALKYAKKGTMIAISGELQIEKKNEKIYTRVNVDDFKFWNNKQDDKVESKGDSTEFELTEDFFKDTKTDLPF
jgi:single-strand DNA-binding protein